MGSWVIEPTADGSPTLRHPVFGDTYHSLRGAVGEARHVFIEAGLNAWIAANPSAGAVRILEVGFGSGLNCLLTARYSPLEVHYTGIELYPLDEATWRALDYASDPLFASLHEAPWEAPTPVAPGFTLEKRRTDLVACNFGATFDIVYMDAFAPDTQPEMWTQAVFEKLHAATAPHAVLTTYCAKGEVKRAMRAAGFQVERLPGALGKRHMLRARK